MASISQSVAWWCLVPEKLNPEEFVRAVAETGYAAIDLVPTYYELVAAHGLAISSVIAHGSLTVGLNRRDQHDRIEKEIIANLADPQKWQIPNMICFSGNWDLLDDDTGAKVTVGLDALSHVAADHFRKYFEGKLAAARTYWARSKALGSGQFS